MIKAPWTVEQVAALNRFQHNDFFHPFTCNDGETLVATHKGWICPQCDYTQDWAHAFMFEDLKHPLAT